MTGLFNIYLKFAKYPLEECNEMILALFQIKDVPINRLILSYLILSTGLLVCFYNLHTLF
jgi:hypothetical protein